MAGSLGKLFQLIWFQKSLSFIIFCPEIIFFFRNSKMQNLILNIWHWFINFIYMIWLVSKLNKIWDGLSEIFRREKKDFKAMKSQRNTIFYLPLRLVLLIYSIFVGYYLPSWEGMSWKIYRPLCAVNFAGLFDNSSEVEVLDGKFF